MGKNKLDVLVTFYNQEKYVDRALTSIFSQQCDFTFNVLIGDDGSTDATVNKIKEWQKRFPGRITLYTMQREKGKKYIGGFRASQNRLNLLKYVTSDYFIFLDGDDYYTDVDKFQKQANILDNPNNSDCIGCSHQIEAVYPDGSKNIFSMLSAKEGKYDLKRYWYDMYFHTDTIMIRSSVIDSLQFDILENNFNDNLITYSIMQNGKLYYCPNVMAAYDQTGYGIWTGGKAIVNNLRNMFLFDLSLILNKGMIKQTDVRLAETWKDLYKLRKEIDSKELESLYEEAADKNLKWSLKWIKYNDMDSLNRLSLFMRFTRICAETFVYKCFRKGLKLAKNCVSFLRK